MTDRAKPMNNAGEPAKNTPLTRVDDRAKEVEAILGLETAPDGLEQHLLTRDEKGNIIEGVDYSEEVQQLCDLIRRAEVEALEQLRNYYAENSGTTSYDFLVADLDSRLKELRGEQ